MKRSRLIPLVFGLVFVFGFYGVTFSGGWEDPACQSPPAPTSGHFIRGSFTVDLDKITSEFSGYAHYNVHLVLKRGNQVHLFSFPSSVGTKGLCDYKVEDTYQGSNLVPGLKTLFAKIPCTLRIGEAFDLSGFPVIADLTITNKDFCVTLEAMIAGDIVIRVVPVP